MLLEKSDDMLKEEMYIYIYIYRYLNQTNMRITKQKRNCRFRIVYLYGQSLALKSERNLFG